MAATMADRGPDDSGTWASGRAALAHRRLQIIDLSAASGQPIVDSAAGITGVFNGCIYNYVELREELTAKGHRFFSHGDSEVVLKAYTEWGEAFVDHLIGMFAIAIVERDTGRVVLARDRLGIKPLYLSESADVVRFASTLPALLAGGIDDNGLDPVGLHQYMSFHSVVPPPHTVLRAVRKLAPATRVMIHPDGKREEEVYWRPEFRRTQSAERPFEELRDEVGAALRRAVERRMVADVPVGVLLSGGVDSSLVVGLLAESGVKDLNTFTIGFESVNGEEGNEFPYSDVIAKEFDTTHHKLEIDSAELVEHLPDCFAAMSEPMVSHDNIGFYLLSREVAKHVKVVQSGQGADEVFGGYFWYPPLLDSPTPEEDYARLFLDRDHGEVAESLTEGYVGDDHSRSFVARHFAESPADQGVDKALHIDTTVMLVDDPVKRVDNMTMAWSLEARVPFLDHELVELAARIPPIMKVGRGGKYVLKEAARAVVPHAVIDRPKGYFPVPELKYLRGRSLDFVRDALNSRACLERGLFRRAYVERLLDAPRDHLTPLKGSKLWQVASLEIWLQAHGL
jgi:asparagine synthase (glutamine-hydrolysing)